ncbi:MAG: HEPN domain-containing protein [Mycobacterium sp.]|nr:HEPN domain-containing protein [Mycobacterium sp.]
MLSMKFYDAAGRDAYLAAFHAAQALISERTGRSLKSHGGVNAEFHKLIRDDMRVDDELRAFLGFAYNLKAIADYETGPNSEIPPERAAEAVVMARRFVTKVIELIGVVAPE